MHKSRIEAMLGDIVSQLDYDIWKGLFCEDCIEDEEEAASTRARLTKIVERYLSE